MMKRTARAAIVGALVAGLVGFAGVAPASADGYGFAWSHGGIGGNTALQVYGHTYIVDSVTVTHNDMQLHSYCGFQSRVTGVSETGAPYATTFGYTSGCTPLPFANSKTLNKRFWINTDVVGQAYHDGAWAPGLPSVRLQ